MIVTHARNGITTLSVCCDAYIQAQSPERQSQLRRVIRICEKLQNAYHYPHGAHTEHRAAIQATRLWNWIDYQRNPEPLWGVMLEMVSEHFGDSYDANSIRFAYA